MITFQKNLCYGETKLDKTSKLFSNVTRNEYENQGLNNEENLTSS